MKKRSRKSLYVKKRARRSLKHVGLPPGTPIYEGEVSSRQPLIDVISFSEDKYHHFNVPDPAKAFTDEKDASVVWYNIDSIQDVDLLMRFNTHFNIHPLITEDIVSVTHRSKIEDYGSHIFIIFVMLTMDESTGEVSSEQVSLILGDKYVISYQEKPGDVFEPIRERIYGAKGRIRQMGADYLAYSLIDAAVDYYFVILEKFNERIDTLEEGLLNHYDPHFSYEIHSMKSVIILLRKRIWPMREVVNGLQRVESGVVRKDTAPYIKDLYDHTIHVVESVETYRDMISGLQDIYLTSISNRMNEIMKVLTMFAAIFIPLTFIAGIYGMNFQYMPELGFRYGYFIVIGIMVTTALSMVVFFKRKKWF